MGTYRKIRIGVLTSSRADFGIYLPLLNAMRADEMFSTDLIVFGTHLSPYHGRSVDEIIRNGFEVKYKISSLLISDDAESIASSFAITAGKFAEFWSTHQSSFDFVFCLGDRFEMAAAVLAGVPLNIAFVHLHGGETTLGAIDNIYRHTITVASRIHFVAAEPFRQRVLALAGTDAACFVSGALSLDNLNGIQFLSREEFEARWNIDLQRNFVLITVHPETVAHKRNEEFVSELVMALEWLVLHRVLVITMPNTDTDGSKFRQAFQNLKMANSDRVYLIENFGTQSYFTCMRHGDFVLGNSSSGIIEAASFGKYVVNVGDRQKGRLTSANVVNVPFEHNEIVRACSEVFDKSYLGGNVYKIGNASNMIVTKLKEHVGL